MNPDSSTLVYPQSELPKLAAMNSLLAEWKDHLAKSSAAPIASKAADLVTDGFYPFYFSQPVRVLFIGRESLDIAGCSYLEILGESYRSTKRIGAVALDGHHFHRRMLKCAHGLVSGRPAWEQIPKASSIGDIFATAAGISFAFMNLCKISNESGDWPADHPTIRAFVEASTKGRNFFEEQIALLEPHLVIAMNIGDSIFSLGHLDQIKANPSVDLYRLSSKGHRSLLLHTFHFSATGKKDEEFYPAICSVLEGQK